MAQLSDEARLYWPFLYAGSNGFGRFQIHYQQILERCFAHFETPPSFDLVRGLLQEYCDCNLLFIYRTAYGQVWAAWDSAVSQQYYSEEDQASPAPPREFAEWVAANRLRTKANRRPPRRAPDDLASDFIKNAEIYKNDLQDDLQNRPSSNRHQTSKQQTTEQQVTSQKFPESACVIQESFPGTDEAMVARITRAALEAKPDADDPVIASALVRTRKKIQHSAGLWLETLPAYLRSARASPQRAPICGQCGGIGETMRKEFLTAPNSAWLDRPHGEVFEPCPECRDVVKIPPGSSQLKLVSAPRKAGGIP